MRHEVIKEFRSSIEPYLHEIESLAVVGGSHHEAEFSVLPESLVRKAIVFGIDPECDEYLDLNTLTVQGSKFDLVLCSQVLEHLWNLDSALENLSQLLSDRGKLWVACPASNRAHGSPGYFSAGYQPELISKFGETKGLETITYGRLGSERCYFMTHALSVWPSESEHSNPISRYEFARLPGPFWKDLLRFIRDLPGRLFALSKSSVVVDDVRFATESFVLMKKS